MDANRVRTESFVKLINSFGFSFIFGKRAKKYSFRVNLLKVFGIVVPALIGAVALSYKYEVLRGFIYIATPFTIIQFIISVFAVIYKWDDELSYCYESSQQHLGLYSEYKTLYYSDIEADVNGSEHQLNLLEREYLQRAAQDTKHNISEWELRRGMRYSLREHNASCNACEQKPKTMESTDCGVCGQFSLKHRLKSIL